MVSSGEPPWPVDTVAMPGRTGYTVISTRDTRVLSEQRGRRRPRQSADAAARVSAVNLIHVSGGCDHGGTLGSVCRDGDAARCDEPAGERERGATGTLGSGDPVANCRV